MHFSICRFQKNIYFKTAMDEGLDWSSTVNKNKWINLNLIL